MSWSVSFNSQKSLEINFIYESFVQRKKKKKLNLKNQIVNKNCMSPPFFSVDMISSRGYQHELITRAVTCLQESKVELITTIHNM